MGTCQHRSKTTCGISFAIECFILSSLIESVCALRATLSDLRITFAGNAPRTAAVADTIFIHGLGGDGQTTECSGRVRKCLGSRSPSQKPARALRAAKPLCPPTKQINSRRLISMAFQVDRSGRQRQNFGNPAAAQTQYETKELHLQGHAAHRLDETSQRSAALRHFRLPVDP